MNPVAMIEFDPDWFDEEEDEEFETLGQFFIRDEGAGGFTQIDSAHLAHFIALYEREDDLLN